ncbi:hypothetical protein CCP4SC76_220004 [Gammaproteobacteria bacterium]
MITDQPIYQFLATGAEAFRVLSGGITLRGDYRFGSVTINFGAAHLWSVSLENRPNPCPSA